MKLAVVVGHTLKSQGAKAIEPLLQTEYEYNLDLSRLVKGFSMSKGVETKIFMRDRVGLAGCYGQVEDWGPDAVVELHFNSFANAKVRGTETLAGGDEESKEWAMHLQTAICDALGRSSATNRGVKVVPDSSGERGWYSVNQNPTAPNALIEPFFGSNPGDSALGLDRRAKIAEAIVDAMISYCRRFPYGSRKLAFRNSEGSSDS